MWYLQSVRTDDIKVLESLLLQGYEPFAVTPDMGADRVWLRMKKASRKSKPRE